MASNAAMFWAKLAMVRTHSAFPTIRVIFHPLTPFVVVAHAAAAWRIGRSKEPIATLGRPGHARLFAGAGRLAAAFLLTHLFFVAPKPALRSAASARRL